MARHSWNLEPGREPFAFPSGKGRKTKLLMEREDSSWFCTGLASFQCLSSLSVRLDPGKFFSASVTPTPLLQLQQTERFDWTSRSLVESPWLQHLMRSSYVIDLNKCFVYLAYPSCSYMRSRAEHSEMSHLCRASPWVTDANCGATALQTCSKAIGLQWHFDKSEVFCHTLSLSPLRSHWDLMPTVTASRVLDNIVSGNDLIN